MAAEELVPVLEGVLATCAGADCVGIGDVCADSSLPVRALTAPASEQKMEPITTGSAAISAALDCVNVDPSTCVPCASLYAWQTTSPPLIGTSEEAWIDSLSAFGRNISPPFAASLPKGMLEVLASSPELEVLKLRIISPARGTKLKLVKSFILRTGYRGDRLSARTERCQTGCGCIIIMEKDENRR